MQVRFTRLELRKMKDAIMLHNHPHVTSFSKDDIAFAATNQVAEMRVVDPIYRYSMKPPKGGWNKKVWESMLWPAMIKSSVKVRARMLKKAYDGKITNDHYSVNEQHEIWRQTAKQIGIIYQRKRRHS